MAPIANEIASGPQPPTTKPKEKRRNNEKRKEKSRDAARCRRSRETEIFTELAQELPLKKEDVNQLDKASVMRIAIAYLKIREMLQLFPNIEKFSGDVLKTDEDKNTDVALGENSTDLLKNVEVSQMIKKTLDGFLMILSNEGDIIYVSDNITEYLGIAKLDILGQQIWEYSHQCDHAELKEALNLKRNSLGLDKIKSEHNAEETESVSTEHRDLFVRYKCTLTSRGRSINIKSASYKVIHMTGHLVISGEGERVFVAVGRPIPHPSNIEIPLGSSTFLTKHSLDMKFTYVDEKMFSLMGYNTEDLKDKSMFTFHHAADAEGLMSTFKSVIAKGQGETSRYRFLGKYGGYCWIVTQATIVYDKMKPQSVVCVNYVISNLEKENEIYSFEQYEAKQTQKQIKPQIDEINQEIENITEEEKTSLEEIIKQEQQKQTSKPQNSPIQTATSPTSSSLQNPKLILPQSPQTITIAAKSPTTALHHQLKSSCSLESKCLKTENRPKSVTASVFRTVPSSLLVPFGLDTNNISANGAGLNQTNQLLPTTFNANLRAPQSVTASVLTPLSQLAVGKPNIKACSTTTASILSPLPIAATVPLSSQPQQQEASTLPSASQAMNKGFLSFEEDAELIMLKEEPDDLAHLAPTAVDACMPLDDTTPLFGEMLVGLMGSYSSLLPDDINSLDSPSPTTTATTPSSVTTSNTNESNSNTSTASSATTSSPNNNTNNGNSTSNSNYSNNSNNSNTAARTICNTTLSVSEASSPTSLSSASSSSQSSCSSTAVNCNSNSNCSSNKGTHIDPFINYREESNDTNCSQHLLSPSVTSKSPEASSLPSLCSPQSLNQEDNFAFMTMDDEMDLSMRAPYIPMNEQDDLPLLTDDLMWYNTNAFTTDDLNLSKDADAMQQLQHHTSLLYHQQQQQPLQQHFSNSLCSSPASTVSSLSPSPVSQHTQHAALPDAGSGNVFTTDSSELAALLCGSGSGTLSILGGNSCGGSTSGLVAENEEDSCGGLSGLTDNDTNGDYKLQNFQLQLLQQQQLQQQQQQRHQNMLSGGLNIECKKQKFNSAIEEAPCFSDSIDDAFYSKDSSNLDCWNDLLQINVNDTNSSTSLDEDCKHNLHNLQQQQNIILNAVPLITIQGNKNMLQQQQQPQQQQQCLITQDDLRMGDNTNRSSNGKVSTIKLLNGNGGLPIATTATIRLVENKRIIPIITSAATATPKTAATLLMQHGNKRHLTSSNVQQGEIKRLKSGVNAVNVELPATPQLLQQLMAPMQQQHQAQNTTSVSVANDLKQRKTIAAVLQHQRWTAAANSNGKPNNTQQSNSVLKNLLISGCDEQEDSPMQIDEDNSMDASTLTQPLSVVTTSPSPTPNQQHLASVLRNFRHNPMFAGPGMLDSPPFASDDSSPPGLMACDSDGTSDSGIDDISLSEAVSPLKITTSKNSVEDFLPNDVSQAKAEYVKNTLTSNKLNMNEKVTPLLLMNNIEESLPAAPPPNINEIICSNKSGKTSQTFSDNSNPLMTPFLMDLTSNDYNMNTEPYLEQSDIDNVLSEWTHELV